MVNFEEQYQAQFKPLQDAFPLNSEVFAKGKIYKVIDYGFCGSKPHLVGIDREGNEMQLNEWHTVEYKLCTRCGGSGRYSWNMTHGSLCYGCSGVGKEVLPPEGVSKIIKGVCVVDFPKFNFTKGAEFSGRFCGFSKTGGTPLYYVVNKHAGYKILLSNLQKHFQIQ